MLAYYKDKNVKVKASPVPKAGVIDSSFSGVCAFDVGVVEHTVDTRLMPSGLIFFYLIN